LTPLPSEQPKQSQATSIEDYLTAYWKEPIEGHVKNGQSADDLVANMTQIVIDDAITDFYQKNNIGFDTNTLDYIVTTWIERTALSA
jgi:hypothetical protein